MSKRQLLCNIFGGFGYLSCLLQWLWIMIIWLPTVMNGQMQALLTPARPAHRLPLPSSNLPSPLLIAIAVGVTVVIMAITIVVLLRMPRTIAKTGQKLTHKSADTLLPAITHHHLITKKERRQLTSRLVKAVKLTLVLAPFVGTLAAYAQHLELGFDLAVFVASWLAIASLIWFTLQYIFARLLRVPLEKLT